ncbi:deoxyribose-phosphate aldolase [Neosynechococcus sphagnicola sy1]|uniref:Deoxyribose-phosphate aldolase n=1 Tax=Neosynechococcus sphagnicola sy1 TaxID=1497020 RepID=A0A098TK86_9CYAN|nr:deoxyribose-phosphate aldolase [Neosynechococcus sphagnicola]KGF72691.1 deoxyribose-phosphate aldolase [Neosynechococcus sphagnicola sy1]
MTADYPDIDLAPLIDHALLSPMATPEQIEKGCDEAVRFGFAAVCVYPVYVRQVAMLLQGKVPKVCTVIGFPSGASTAAVKLYEAQEAVDLGATELDVMINLGWLKTGQVNELHQEIAEICDSTGQLVKAILEMSRLNEAEIRLAAEVCMDAGVAFLKTSTGWAGGATVPEVRLLKEITKNRLGIKASGGIRTAEQAIELVLAGASRLGTSHGVEIVRQRDNLDKDLGIAGLQP